MFNLFAYSNMLPGSNGKILDWYDLMYNRVNWRDKDKKQKAHPRSNFHLIDKEYQLVCLMAKSRTVEDYINTHGETFYTKRSFLNVVNTGIDCNDLQENDSFNTIRRYIHNRYNNVG